MDEIVKLTEEARVYRDNQKVTFVINRKIANTIIGRDVREALAAYTVPTLAAAVTQRAIFAEAVAQGLAVYELDPHGPAEAEIEAVTTELLEVSR